MHTKGPWRARADAVKEHPDVVLHTIWTDDMTIIVARTCFAPASEANARLIAKAPTMYDQLASARAIMEKFVDSGMARSKETYAEMKAWMEE